MIFSKFLELIFPSHCLYCDKIISKNSLFCSNCWPKLKFITKPKCKICSHPFEIEITNMQPLCAACLSKKPSFDKSITIFRYNYVIKKIIRDLKYYNQTFIAKKIAKILANKIKNRLDEYDALIAVPLHRDRLRKRRYNQSHLICKELSKLFPQLAFYHDLMFRVKNTEPQSLLRRKQRKKNLKRAFLVNKKYRDFIKGKRILLLDDVITTGATLESCAKELKRRKAQEITVITVAKTIFNS